MTDKETLISVYPTNLGKYVEGTLMGEWLDLPTTKEAVQSLYRRIGLDGRQYEEMFLTDWETSITGLHECIGEYSRLDELNYLAVLLSELNQYDLAVFAGAIEYGAYASTVEDLINLAQNLDNYDYLPDICNDADLGYYWIEESGCYDLKDPLASYFDYERFGRDIRLEQGGVYTDSGYISSNGGSQIEHYRGIADIPEEYKVDFFPVPEVLEKTVKARDRDDR